MTVTVGLAGGGFAVAAAVAAASAAVDIYNHHHYTVRGESRGVVCWTEATMILKLMTLVC